MAAATRNITTAVVLAAVVKIGSRADSGSSR